MYIFLITLSILVGVGAEDQTLVEGVVGTPVVETTLIKIQTLCIFNDDSFFVRRLAHVETNDGNEEVEDFNGGIWKIDSKKFEETKKVYKSYLENIKKHFDIDWENVEWEELDKPLYSALAAYLYVRRLQERGYVMPSDLNSQSLFWDEHFDKHTDNGKFLSKAIQLEKIPCEGALSDIIFVVDGSSSVSIKDFEKQQEFVIKFMKRFDVKPTAREHTRFSLLQFGETLNKEFDFDEHKDHASYEGAVLLMKKLNGGSNTHLALKYVAEKAFTPKTGARSESSKIVILFTNSYSDFPKDTLKAAAKVHQKNYAVFVVGIGQSTHADELSAIATDPDCLYLQNILSYNHLEHITSNLLSRVCVNPMWIDSKGTDVIVGGDNEVRCRIRSSRQGNTIEAKVDFPTANYTNTIYFSRSTLPSSIFYDYKLDVQSNDPSRIHIPYDVTAKDFNLYCYIEGRNEKTGQINISVKIGANKLRFGAK